MSFGFVCTTDFNRVSPYPYSELVEYFRAQMQKNPDMASAVAAIRTLLEFLKRDKGVFKTSILFVVLVRFKAHVLLRSHSCLYQAFPASSGETILGLRESLTWATACLTRVDSSVAVSSGGELFLRFISLTSLEHQVSCVSFRRAQVSLRSVCL